MEVISIANSEARLRLVVDCVANTGAFSTLVSQAETAAREINAALNGGVVNANGGASGTFGPIIPDSALGGLVNMREQVTLTRKELEAFATGEAKRLGLALGKDVADPTRVATGDLKSFYEQMNGVRVRIDDEMDPSMKRMEQMFALQSIQQASEALKRFGEELAQVLGEGISLAMQFEETNVDIKNALEINKDASIDWSNQATAASQLDTTLKELGATALKVALDTKFNDTEMNQMLAYLTQNGVGAKDIIDGVAYSTAELAQATNSEWKPAAETMVAIWHSMGNTLRNEFTDPDSGVYKVKDAMGAVADVLTNISNSTGESLQNVANTMKYVGPIADELNIPFKDLGVAVDILARAGIRGSQAGTALRRMFTNLTPVSDKAEEAMRDLGIITADGSNKFYDAAGNVKSLAEIQGVLYESMKDLNDEQKIFALRTIFGQYAMQSMAKIASTTPEEFRKLTDVIYAEHTAEKKSDDWRRTAAAQWQVFTENVTAAKKALGDQLLDSVVKIVEPLNKMVEAFHALSPETKNVIASVLAVVSGLAIAIGTIGSVVASVGLMNIGLAAAGTSLGGIAAAAAPVIAILAAVVAVGYLIYESYVNNFGGFRDLVDEVWVNYVKPTLIDAATAIRDALVGAVQAIKAWWDEMAPSVEKAVTNIIAAIRWLEPLWSALWDGLKGVVSGAWTIITSVIEGAWGVISGIFDFFVHLIAGDWDKLWGDFLRIFEGWKTLFLGVFEGAFKMVYSVVKTYWSAGVGLIAKAYGEGLDNTHGLLTTWKSKFTGTWESVWKGVHGGFTMTKNLLTGDWEGALNTIESVTGVKKEVIVNAVMGVVNAVKAKFDEMVMKAREWGANLIDMLIDGIKSKFTALTDSVRGVADTIASYLGFHSPTELGPASDADTWMPNLMRMLTDGISEGIPALQNAATSAAQAIADPLGKLDMSNASSVDKYARLILDKGDALSAIDNEYKPQIDALNRQMADAGTREERMALQRQLQQIEDAYAQKRDATTKSYDDQITAFKNGTTTLTNINAQATATNTAITNAGAAGAVNAFTQMAQNIAGQAQMLAQNVKLAWNDMWTTLTAATTQALTAIVSAMTAGSAQLVNTLTAMIATLKAMFTQLATDARTWGANLGEMFADGLRSKLAEVEAIAKQIAATVNSYVGFHSPAERGPGADADTWAPNFMRMFTDGIVNARPALQAALSGVAMDMNFAVGGGYAGVAPVAGGGRAPIIVNITYNGGSRSELDKFARDVQAIIRNAQ